MGEKLKLDGLMKGEGSTEGDILPWIRSGVRRDSGLWDILY